MGIAFQYPLPVLWADEYVTVFDQRQPELVVEAQDVVVRNRFALLLQPIADNPRPAKRIQRRRKIEIANLPPYPIHQFGFAALVAGGGEVCA